MITISGLRGTVTLYLDSRRAEKDGQAITLRIPPVLFKDAAFIPLWAVANITGAQVHYNPAEGVLEMSSRLTGPGIEHTIRQGTLDQPGMVGAPLAVLSDE